MQAQESGFRGLYHGAHPYGVHLFAGPDEMHLVDEGLAGTLIQCIAIYLHSAGTIYIVCLPAFACVTVVVHYGRRAE